MTNGNLFFVETSKTGFAEVNMLGQTVETWSTPSGYLADEHEDLLTDHGTILYVNITAEDVTNFPSSATDSNAPTENAIVEGSRVVEISATNSALLNFWTLIDMLDPVRIDYLCFQLFTVFGNDPEHANAIIDQPADDSLIVSLRNQDAVIKFSRAGQIKWILGPPENWGPEWQPFLLTPVGTPFEWNYGQHAPTITPQGTLLLYDDGNCRAEPFAPPVPNQDNYSRAAEFSIDETNMQVSQVWEFTGANTDRLFTGAVGNATWLPQTGNVLVDFGYVSYENGLPAEPLATNATIVHLKEVTHRSRPASRLRLGNGRPDQQCQHQFVGVPGLPQPPYSRPLCPSGQSSGQFDRANRGRPNHPAIHGGSGAQLCGASVGGFGQLECPGRGHAAR